MFAFGNGSNVLGRQKHFQNKTSHSLRDAPAGAGAYRFGLGIDDRDAIPRDDALNREHSLAAPHSHQVNT